MAKNNWSSDAFKKAQNLLSPGYNQADTFEAVTTLSKDDANALARSMKLDTGVTGYGNTPFDDSQASMNAYFPSMNQDYQAETLPLEQEPAVMTYEDRMQRQKDFDIPTSTNYNLMPDPDTKLSKGMNWIGNKYDEIFNTVPGSSTRDDGKVMADMPENVNIYNNPGNIKVGQAFDGESGTYANGRFAKFDTPQAGLRAMKMDLTTKIKRHKGNLQAMIEEYAPSSDNNDTKKYLEVVQKYAGKKKVYSPSDLDNIIKGFIAMENKAGARDFYFDILDSQ
jgi:hypothetical protein